MRLVPVRVQFDPQALVDDTVFVGDGSEWENPYKVDVEQPVWHGGFVRLDPIGVLVAFDHSLRTQFSGATLAHAKATLVGRDLSCWCPIGAPCHADVLIAAANPTLPRCVSCSARHGDGVPCSGGHSLWAPLAVVPEYHRGGVVHRMRANMARTRGRMICESPLQWR